LKKPGGEKRTMGGGEGSMSLGGEGDGKKERELLTPEKIQGEGQKGGVATGVVPEGARKCKRGGGGGRAQNKNVLEGSTNPTGL